MRYLNLIKTISNWPAYFAHKYNLTTASPAVFELRGGGRILVPREVMHEFKEVFFDEAYLAGMPLGVKEGATVVDIGANIGAFSVFAATRFKGCRVIAFEPDPVNFAVLARNAEGVPARAITPVERAIAGSAGTLVFHRGDAEGVSTSGSLVRSTGEKITVEAVTLEEAFAAQGIATCDLMKMDCEGAEFDILYGASDAVLARIRQMVVEIHDQGRGTRTRAAVIAHLAAKGFQVKDGMHHLLWAWRAAP
ncbi:FkbM family methyltransferase [Xanthobacter sp. KR7-225]|uniref:FkbM family methyltransferase n=1 Tax=Xanthobacter sp. KR7-225 TaxID=3156613 RepID=UPI0032B60CA6